MNTLAISTRQVSGLRAHAKRSIVWFYCHGLLSARIAQVLIDAMGLRHD